jgi:hypothetical protein
MVGGQKENGICVVAKGPICTSASAVSADQNGGYPGIWDIPKNATLRREHDDKL